jgi:hypothetical protein
MHRHPTVLFVCLHGAAKSVIAAQHLARLAAERRIDLRTASAGVDPDTAIPPHVIAGLAADGLASPDSAPQQATAGLLGGADLIISFGCDLDEGPTRGNVLQWNDVPAVSDGYDAARDVIVRRLPTVLDLLTGADPADRPINHN